jgi:hypothetical protein
MLFMELDQGAVIRKETSMDNPKIVRLVIGNPTAKSVHHQTVSL